MKNGLGTGSRMFLGLQKGRRKGKEEKDMEEKEERGAMVKDGKGEEPAGVIAAGNC